ncbi:MAG: FtsQ-type POTRA domain-containing protein, partial [Bacillota bacterium]|nr:FtsQ-type POTRA domain-containing protein [Bacillota bacterium]
MADTGQRNRSLPPSGSGGVSVRSGTRSARRRNNSKAVGRRKRKPRFNLGGCIFRIIIVIALCLGVFFFLQSDVFTVKSIDVRGLERLDEEDIVILSGIKTGENLFDVDRSEAQELISLHAGVESVSVNTRPPHKILITIQEREAVAWIQGDECYYLMDQEGYIFIKRDEYNDYLPLITGLDLPENLSVGLKLSEVPGLEDAIAVSKVFMDYCRGQMRELHYTEKGNFIFYIGDLKVRLGKNEEMWKKKNVLDGILQQIPAEALSQVEYIDVSSPGNPAVAGYDIIAEQEKAEAEEKAKKEAEKNGGNVTTDSSPNSDTTTAPDDTDTAPAQNDTGTAGDEN